MDAIAKEPFPHQVGGIEQGEQFRVGRGEYCQPLFACQTVPVEHARALEAALKKAGVEVELDLIKDGTHAVAGAGPAVAVRASAYMRERLGAPR